MLVVWFFTWYRYQQMDKGLDVNILKYGKVQTMSIWLGGLTILLTPFSSPLITGGVQIEVVTGKSTEIKDLEVNKGIATGKVAIVGNPEPVLQGKVIVTQWSKEDEKLSKVQLRTGGIQ